MDFPKCAACPKPKCKLKKCCFGIIIGGIVLYCLYQVIYLAYTFRCVQMDFEKMKKCGGVRDKEDIKKESAKRLYECKHPKSRSGYTPSKSRNYRITSMVKEALKEYNADKTGKTDFALESAGGSIVGTTGDTQLYSSAKTIFGMPLCEGKNGPRAMIQPNMSPGSCWAFKGAKGSAIVKLLGPVYIDGVSLEHISSKISPTQDIDTAPKKFSIWGLKCKDDKEGVALGQFTYLASGETVQSFPIQCTETSYEYIEFKVHSNHGNPHFTCVYRYIPGFICNAIIHSPAKNPDHLQFNDFML